MKILAIGDSLSLPGHGNRYEDTWIYLAKMAFSQNDFITLFRRSLTTDVLVNEGGGELVGFPPGSDCLEHFSPDVVILQLGIVDCSPRLFKKNSLSLKILKALPSNLSVALLEMIKKFKKRSVKNSYVPIKKFYANLTCFLDRCKANQVKKVIYIAIAYPANSMESKSPLMWQSVSEYNEILVNLAEKYDFYNVIFPLSEKMSNENVYDDGYHPNPKGNQLVFEKLAESLSSL